MTLLAARSSVQAVAGARDRLGASARDVAAANLHSNSRAQREALVDAAHAAIFSDAVSSALRARIEEMRTVSK